MSQAPLGKLLIALVNRAASTVELQQLVHHTRAVAESYVVSYRASLLPLLRLNGITLSDLAVDCIGDMYAEDEQHRHFRFERFAASLTEPLERISEEDLRRAFTAFVLRFVKIRLAKMYGEADPQGARIYRNLREGVARVRSLTLFEDFRGTVVGLKEADRKEERPAFPPEELERGLLEELPGGANTVVFLRTLSRVLRGQNRYRCSVPLAELVAVTKRVHVDMEDAEDVEPFQGPPDGNGIDGEFLRKCVMGSLRTKILSKYVADGKVTIDDAGKLYRALDDLVAAYCEGKRDGTPLFCYLERHFGISEEEYKARWRTKMEYLSKLAREEMKMYLANNL